MVVPMRMVFLVLFSVFLGLPACVQAAESSIGVIDVTVIFAQADAAKSIDEQRNTLREGFLAEIADTENALRKEEQELANVSKDISQEDYAKRRVAYEERMISTRKMAQEKKRVLDEASGAAMDKLREELYLVAQQIANERGYSLVISNRDVIAGEKSLDITEEALKRLNEKLKTIDLKLAKAEDKK
jgi:outer membrane protein